MKSKTAQRPTQDHSYLPLPVHGHTWRATAGKKRILLLSLTRSVVLVEGVGRDEEGDHGQAERPRERREQRGA